jgi:hypothetical protein
LIKEELEKMDYDFEIDLDTTIMLLYINMSGGYFEISIDPSTRIKKIRSHILDVFKKDSHIIDKIERQMNFIHFDIRKILSNFSYWIFDKEVYEAYLYLNVL